MPRNKRAVAAPDDVPFEGSIDAFVSEAFSSSAFIKKAEGSRRQRSVARICALFYGRRSSLSVLNLTSASTEAARAAKLEAKAEKAKAAREKDRQDFFNVPSGQLSPETKRDLVLRLKAMGGTETSK